MNDVFKHYQKLTQVVREELLRWKLAQIHTRTRASTLPKIFALLDSDFTLPFSAIVERVLPYFRRAHQPREEYGSQPCIELMCILLCSREECSEDSLAPWRQNPDTM
jgi:hypothetical protein